MDCIACGVWQLAEGDLVCAWCGESYLRITATLEPAALPADDYPPPVMLTVRNDSPLGAVTLARISASESWVAPSPEGQLPQTVAPGATATLFLDVDTFAAGAGGTARIAVAVLYAPEPGVLTVSVGPPGALQPASHPAP